MQTAMVVDPQRMETLLIQHGPAIRRMVALRIPADLRPVLDEDDVMQETYAYAFLQAKTFEERSPEATRSWLQGIALNKLTDAIRGLRAQKRGGSQRPTQPSSEDDRLFRLAEVALSDDTSPSHCLRRRELLHNIRGALEKLPPAFRDVIVLYDLQLFPISSVAQRLGCTEGAAYMRRNSALKRLRDELSSYSHYL